MKIDGSLARNIDFEVANFNVQKITRRKTSILKLQSVKIGGSLARNAHFDAPTCIVSSLWLSCGLTVSMGEAAKPILFQGAKASCNVVLRGRCGTSWHCHVSPTCRTSFCLAGAILLRTPHYTLHSTTLYTPHTTLHTPHTTLPALHFTLCTPHFTHSTLHSTPYTSHFTLHTPHFTLHTPHSTLHTLHFTLYTPHSTLYTLHSTLYTPHFALRTWKFTLHTPHFSHYTPHYTLHTLHSTLFRIPQSSGTVTGKNVQDCSNMFSQKCCTWLHSGSWVASCFKKHSVKIGICHPPWNIL